MGTSTVLPLQKGRRNKFQPCIKGEGGRKNCCEVVLTEELEVLAILKWGAIGFHPLKRASVNSFILS